MTIIRPDLDLVIKLYGSCLPDFSYILRQIESNKRWIGFSPRLFELTKNLKCQNYPELYQDEARISSALFRAFIDTDEDIKNFLDKLTNFTEEEQFHFISEHIENAIEVGEWVDDNCMHLDDIDWSPIGIAKAKKELEQLSQEEQKLAFKFYQNFLMFCLASFFNYFSIMVHGRRLTQLVSEAILGNDESFCLAVHIDKNIIHKIPYFVERYQRAHNEGDEAFIKKVSYRLNSPQLKGKVRHRLLYMLFAVLEGSYWLNDLKHREILEICDELQLDLHGNRIESENALTKALAEYRSFQKFNGMSMQ